MGEESPRQNRETLSVKRMGFTEGENQILDWSVLNYTEGHVHGASLH